MVDGSRRQQGWDCNMFRIDVAIREDNDVITLVFDHLLRFRTNPFDRRFHRLRLVTIDAVGDIECIRAERTINMVLDPADTFQIYV